MRALYDKGDHVFIFQVPPLKPKEILEKIRTLLEEKKNDKDR